MERFGYWAGNLGRSFCPGPARNQVWLARLKTGLVHVVGRNYSPRPGGFVTGDLTSRRERKFPVFLVGRPGLASGHNRDESRNSLFFDFLTGGELFQNHHKLPNRVNFGVKWWELNPSYPVIWTLDRLRVIQLKAVVVAPQNLPITA